jgi:hypothetical protein
MITGNLRRAREATHLLIDTSAPDGASSGLRGPSLVSCINLYTVDQSNITRVIGNLSLPLMAQIDDCLKASLGLS